MSFDVFWLQRICKIFYLNIRNQLKILEKSINLEPEFAQTKDLKTIVSQLNSETNQHQNPLITDSKNTKSNILLMKNKTVKLIHI
ncbi:MAG: hypothetical protein F6K23_03565 [Okeania sp. SIO2C9]|uniref:hypothetical protein n=1 Tax=Okeania sp. SIO2C9 TaxID=2607791 RepID=UPI0013C25C05|nr:hypothetical protein [Okeania sp. SIO2C9]NEQ72234.1 hypothetical protein [Okeania sp. SIO2C9]